MQLTAQMDNTFIIGDVHGNFDRFEALLIQEGIINTNGERTNKDITVVQVGDLINAGKDNKTGDELTYNAVKHQLWCDIVLWGNHDKAVFDKHHLFAGYDDPEFEIDPNIYRFAHHAHGYLITHAGLAPNFGNFDTAEQAANYLNGLLPFSSRYSHVPILDNISRARGGADAAGGILWRDFSEPLAPLPQIYGHSRADTVRRTNVNQWCIDIADKGRHGSLAGIYLPSCSIVGVSI